MPPPADWTFEKLFAQRPELDDSGMGTILGADDFVELALAGAIDDSVVMGSLGSWLTHAVSDVAHTVSSAAKDVGHAVSSTMSHAQRLVEKGGHNPVAKLAEDAAKIVAVPLKAVKEAAHFVTNNPVWDIVQTGVSFIPGVGQAVSVGMSTMSAVGRGASIADIGVSALRGAIPGGPVVQAAFDVATGMALHGESIGAAGIAALRNQVSNLAPAALKQVSAAAHDLGIAQILGKHALAQDVAVKAGLALMPKDPKLLAIYQAGAGLAKTGNVAKEVVARVKSIVPQDRASQSALQAGMLAARAKEIGSRHVDTLKKTIPVGKEGKAMLDAVHGAQHAALAKAHSANLTRAKVALVAAMRLVRSADLHDVHAKQIIDHTFVRAKGKDPHAIVQVQLFALAKRTLKTHGQMIAGAWYDWFYSQHPAHDMPAWNVGEQAFASYQWRAPPRTRGNFLFSW